MDMGAVIIKLFIMSVFVSAPGPLWIRYPTVTGTGTGTGPFSTKWLLVSEPISVNVNNKIKLFKPLQHKNSTKCISKLNLYTGTGKICINNVINCGLVYRVMEDQPRSDVEAIYQEEKRRELANSEEEQSSSPSTEAGSGPPPLWIQSFTACLH
jgi:hypothetical protein